ncbi:hypothetical protein BMS3Bbin01_02275 [bacterium BMS3Bbin01]|nr:hypothetical protein BMS3Bbin01_02275 [bacterium BMS3Bbin01]
MAMRPLAAMFTEVFNDLYGNLPAADVPKVDAMLDRLEKEHAHPEMRNVIRVANTTLFATPRIYAPTAIYRINWCYDGSDPPTAIVCITVAEI